MAVGGSIDVLVVGAGPVGLTAAIELRRRGVEARIVERLVEPPQYAKAVGIQPRTLEVWEDMGIAATMLDASTPFEGQIVYVNGAEVARMTLELPPDVPYAFVGLPQYETERLLAEHLVRLGGRVERGVELRSLEQDGDGVTAILAGPEGDETVRCRYLAGCDGAHSVVRKQLGIGFEGDRFPEEYMLGDVEVDWSLPHTYGIRAMHNSEDGTTDDILVCIPLPGHGRYRMSMLVPPDLAGTGVDHGFASDRPAPTLGHIQAVLDRLAPEPATARNLRWSSVFRISHRLVDRYSAGRVFLCGDAAHIHPPTGAQGMNTGIQDAYNLGWKLALAVDRVAAPGLLDSYHAERRPVGEEVVGRTVRHAREGFEADPDDPSTVIRREAQLLVGYPESPRSTQAPSRVPVLPTPAGCVARASRSPCVSSTSCAAPAMCSSSTRTTHRSSPGSSLSPRRPASVLTGGSTSTRCSPPASSAATSSCRCSRTRRASSGWHMARVARAPSSSGRTATSPTGADPPASSRRSPAPSRSGVTSSSRDSRGRQPVPTTSPPHHQDAAREKAGSTERDSGADAGVGPVEAAGDHIEAEARVDRRGRRLRADAFGESSRPGLRRRNRRIAVRERRLCGGSAGCGECEHEARCSRSLSGRTFHRFSPSALDCRHAAWLMSRTASAVVSTPSVLRTAASRRSALLRER